MDFECEGYREERKRHAQNHNGLLQDGTRLEPIPAENFMTRRNMVPFSPEEKRSVDQDAAMAIYLTATPFSTLRNSYFHKFLNRLDPSYTPPSRDQLSGALLDEAYNKVSTEVDKVLQRQQQLHIIMDEGDDISGNRIINMCILTSLLWCISLLHERYWIDATYGRKPRKLGTRSN